MANRVASLLLPLLALITSALASQEPPKGTVRIGMIGSLFETRDQKTVLGQTQPFADQVKRRTGLDGEFVLSSDVDSMAKGLKDGKLQLGVLHGVEYGWLRQNCPDCKPVLIAVNETPILTAHLLVAKDSPASGVDDLKGKKLILARRAPMHTRLFLERLIKQEPKAFFQGVTDSDADTAIDAVVDGKADVTVVSNVMLDTYRQRKPGRFNRLRTLVESAKFPAAVVVGRAGAAEPDAVRKFRESLLTSDRTVEGQQMLTLWRLTGFLEVPADYERVVEEIVKEYPPPQP